MPLTRKCKVDGCTRNAWAKRLCKSHYHEHHQLEKDVRKSCFKYAAANDWLAIHITPLNWVGLPDCLFIKRGGGALVFVEFKRPTVAKARLKQDKVIQDLRNFGIRVELCNNYATFCALLRSMA